MNLSELVKQYHDEVNDIFANEYYYHIHLADRNIIYPGEWGYDEEPVMDARTDEEVIKEDFSGESPADYFERQHKKQFQHTAKKARALGPKDNVDAIFNRLEVRINSSKAKLPYTAFSRLSYRKLDVYMKEAAKLDNEREKQEAKESVSRLVILKDSDRQRRRQEILNQLKKINSGDRER